MLKQVCLSVADSLPVGGLALGRCLYNKFLTGKMYRVSVEPSSTGYSRKKPREKVKNSCPNLARTVKTQKSPNDLEISLYY